MRTKLCRSRSLFTRRGFDCGGSSRYGTGADKGYNCFYVKFSAEYQYNHHFVWLMANRGSMAMLGIYDPGKQRSGQCRWQTGHVGRW